MSAPVAKIFVQVCGTEVRARICGRANFAASPDFKMLITSMEAKGFQQYVLDLNDCLIMDSTFVGVLASLGDRMDQAGSDAFVELARPNERIVELIDNLGIADMFRITERDIGALENCQEVDASGAGHTKVELSRTSLESHTTLMHTCPDGVAKFKDVTEFLAEEIKRLESQ